MSIEKDLATLAANSGRIADALEAVAKLMNNPITTTVTSTVAEGAPEAGRVQAAAKAAAVNKPKPLDTAPEVDPLDEPAKPAKDYTIDDVRAALKSYREVNGGPAMLELLKKYGSESLSALDPSKFAAIIVDAGKVG